MGQKKVRINRSQNKPIIERSFYEQSFMQDNYQPLARQELLNLVRGGEDSEIEFKLRLSNPEKIVSEIVAFANSGGGAIIFGVSDTYRIEGLDNIDRVEEEVRHLCSQLVKPAVYPYIDKIAFDNGRRVLVLEVDGRRAPHTTQDNKYYIRIGATKREATCDEIVELYRSYNPLGFEQIPFLSTTIDSIDESFIWSYVKKLCDHTKLPEGYPTAMILEEMQLAIRSSDDYVPTISALLLFGKSKELEKVFPHSKLTATRFSGNSITDPIIEQVTFIGNLASLYERTDGFLRRYVILSEDLQARSHLGAGAATYSKAAVLESISNALVHRDYSNRELGVRILVYDNRLEIINPAVIKNLSVKAIKPYGVSIPNNPRIKSFFKNSAYGLSTFSGGIPMVCRETMKLARQDIRIKLLTTEFSLEIPGA